MKNNIPGEDVDDLIGLAAEMMQAEEGMLSEKDLKEIGSELDIPEEYIDRARRKLAEDRKKEEVVEREKKSKKRTIFIGVVVVNVIIIALFSFVLTRKMSSLNQQFTAVESMRLQVKNVKERSQETKTRLQTRPDSSEKDAELSGSTNRVRVETMRLNNAITEYNKGVRGFIGRLASSLSNLPEKITP